MHESATPRRTESAADRIEGNGSAATHLQALQDRALDLPHPAAGIRAARHPGQPPFASQQATQIGTAGGRHKEPTPPC